MEFYSTTHSHRDKYPVYAKYSQYKKILREDFNKRCGYCCDLDKYKISYYAIDHYVPRNPEGCISTIPDTQYENLIYCCSYCNRAKWNKWPTFDTNIENDGKVGFVKPTNPLYRTLFSRTAGGKILPIKNNPLSNYIWKELNLSLPIHALMWRIERLMILEEKISMKLQNGKDEELEKQHYQITKETTKIFRDIFDTND
ncbi:HNH endonuclease [Chryseobacterium sp. Hurlbut01]|uniref:HNH endonuclease n=1 Tax=Chryseobacterium sp. Hurlbut01 TaxID=1681828 RepID=UPI00067CD794|nr:HNH endonuclease [Chryseobacterium sp. Hurlbut01]KNB62256.1 hypothetical protein AC804_05165 [Chryseobacterium sp. Hurlbut01]